MKDHQEFLHRVVEHFPKDNVSVTSIIVLLELSRRTAPVKFRVLAKAIKMSKPRLSRGLSTLVKAGLVDRIYPQRMAAMIAKAGRNLGGVTKTVDGRDLWAELTPAGARLVLKIGTPAKAAASAF